MDFSHWVNEHVFLLFFLLFVTLVIGFRIGVKHGGWNRNLPYMFSLLIFFQYFLITPLYFYLNGRSIIIGTDIENYYGLGAFFPLIGIACFIFGYFAKENRSSVLKRRWRREVHNPRQKITLLFFLTYGMVLINMAVGGIDVKNIFVGDVTVGLGAKGETYFLQNFADSLISIIILAYVYKVRKRTLLVWIVLSFFLFSLLGFRYRILLTLFGLSFCYLYFHKLRLKEIVLGIVGALVFFYFVMLVTENRFALIKKEYSSLRFNPTTFDYANYFEQTRGALADMAIYKVYDNPNKSVQHDYGASMFGYIFIRMIPRAIYPNKDDFYPPPQNKVQFEAYQAWWAKVSGEAILSVACFYIAFGWPGVLFFHFFWGFLLAKLRNSIDFTDNLQILIYIVVALVTFQWVTRAYLPQSVDHAVYMLFPVLILRYFSSKRRVGVPKNMAVA